MAVPPSSSVTRTPTVTVPGLANVAVAPGVALRVGLVEAVAVEVPLVADDRAVASVEPTALSCTAWPVCGDDGVAAMAASGASLRTTTSTLPTVCAPGRVGDPDVDRARARRRPSLCVSCAPAGAANVPSFSRSHS